MPAFLTTSGRGYDEQGCETKFSAKRKRVCEAVIPLKPCVLCAVMRSFLFSCMCIQCLLSLSAFIICKSMVIMSVFHFQRQHTRYLYFNVKMLFSAVGSSNKTLETFD
jgi:hypothetical protein